MQGVLTRIQSLSIRRPRRSGVGWTIAAAVIALFVLMPVLALAFQALQGSPGLWTHLIATVLPPALGDTLVLLAGVAIVTGCLGTALAWLVTAYAFRGRWLLDWMLLLPLAVPTYIIAYAYLDILHPIGPVQGVIRWLLGYESPRDFRLPDIRSMTGCILLLGFVLYPYVYIPTRAMFLTQSASLVEVSRTLGISRRGVFRRVALPLARPAVAIGISLALMEALNDIGAAEFLGVRTLTVSIYTTWITRSDLPGAAQIALFLLFLVVMLVAVERFARRSQGYSAGAQRARPFVPHAVGGAKGVLLFALGLLPVLIGFAAPAAYLVSSAWQRYQFAGLSPRLIGEAVNTVAIAATATAATVVLGLVIAYACRLRPGLATGWLYRLSTLGYAAPGTVVAIGVLIVVAGIDGFLDRAVMHWFGVSIGLFFMGSGAALLYAYSMRFLTISAGTTEAGLSRIPRSFDHASRTLGMTSGATLRLVHLPLSRAAIAAGALLVFVDCVKELPATLLLRPLNFETFATHLYGEAARGTYEEASLAALAIVVIGILPVILLARVGKQNVAD